MKKNGEIVPSDAINSYSRAGIKTRSADLIELSDLAFDLRSISMITTVTASGPTNK